MKILFILVTSAALATSYAQNSSQNTTGGNASKSGTGQTSSSSSATSNASSGQQSSTAAQTSTSSTFDRAFLRRATIDSLQEIQIGQLALTNSQNPAVQDFGAVLIDDHTNALLEAQDLATELGITLPTALTTNQQQQVQTLSTLTGPAFDIAFANVMIQSHLLDISLCLTAVQQATNPDVRSFSLDQLPVLMEHLLIARAIREDLLADRLQTSGSNP